MKLVEGWWAVLLHSTANWVTLIVNTIVAHAIVFLAVLPFAPLYLQLPLAVLIAVVASSPTWLARIVDQPKLRARIGGKSDGPV